MLEKVLNVSYLSFIHFVFASLSTDKMRGTADKISIKELLQAANVSSLDLPSDALNAKGKTFRRHGVVLHVTVSYQNAENTWFGTG